MFKKLLIASSSLLIASSVYASPAPYIGGGIGLNTITSSKIGYGPQTANFRGVPYNLFVGYGGVISQNLYLGAEAFATIVTGVISNKNGLRVNQSFGFGLLPGVMLSDHTLLFLRGAVVKSDFPQANSELQTGLQAGLGVQTSLTQNLDIRSEFDVTSYKTFNNNHGRITDPYSDALNVSLIYQFN